VTYLPNPAVTIGGVNFTGNTVGEVFVSRGRQTVYERTNAGFASIELIDVTGISPFTVGDEVEVKIDRAFFLWENVASSWSALEPSWADVASVVFLSSPVFTGTLSDWSSETTPARNRPIVRYRLQAVGPLATLNRRQILFDGRVSENDAERIGAVLTAALGTAVYDPTLVDPGVFTLAALGTADAGYNALNEAQNAEFSGEGLLFETDDGRIGYQDANRRRLNEREQVLTIPFATLSAEGLRVLQQLADITNTVTVSFENNAVTEVDQDSVDTFGLYETELSTQLVNLSNAEARARNFLLRHAVPSRSLEELPFRLRGVADDNLRNGLLDIAMSDALRVTGVPAAVGFTEFRGFVEGFRLTVSDFDVRLSVTVSDRRLSIASERWGQVLGTIAWQDVDAALTWQDAIEVTV
jgi:hypothetical protein